MKNFTFVTDDDSLDWKNYGVENLINTVVNHKHLGNGSIILCHNGAKYTAQALDSITYRKEIKRLRSRHLIYLYKLTKNL